MLTVIPEATEEMEPNTCAIPAVVLVALLGGCAPQPVIDPDRWIETYDYRQPLDEYLRAEYALSLDRKRVPYVYVYADWCRPCRTLRRQAKTDPKFAELFVETQIILLEFDRLKRVKDAPRLNGVPVILAVERDGTFAEVAFSGVPWTRMLPHGARNQLCAFLELRKVSMSTLKRDCGGETP